jgi:propionate CoA-transferase
VDLSGDGKIKIVSEGRPKKFVTEVSEITFSGDLAVRRGQKLFFVTERAVFQRTADHEVLELIEVAPGLNLQSDVLDQMEFKPVISPNLKLMDARIFRPAKMEILEDLFGHLLDRYVYHESDHTLFVDLFGVTLDTEDDARTFFDAHEQVVRPLTASKGPIHMVANYDGFDLRAGLEEVYSDRLSAIAEKYYASVTRFAGAAFNRAKLGSKILHTWDLDKAFDEFDTNDDGKLTVAELRHGMTDKFGIRLTERELKSLSDETDFFIRRHQFKEFMLNALKSKAHVSMEQ